MCSGQPAKRMEGRAESRRAGLEFLPIVLWRTSSRHMPNKPASMPARSQAIPLRAGFLTSGKGASTFNIMDVFRHNLTPCGATFAIAALFKDHAGAGLL